MVPIRWIALGALALMSLGGCMSDQILQRKAVNLAREFVKDEMRDLSELELDYVRFATPEWQSSPMFKGVALNNSYNWTSQMGVPLDASTTEFNSLGERPAKTLYGCFVWIIPNSKECIIVTGICNPNLEGFSPLRAVRRPIHFGDPLKRAALDRVRTYILQEYSVIQSQPEINEVIRDRIRFSPPIVMESAFLSDLPPAGKKEYSFIWRLNPESKCLTVSGYGSPDFSDFKQEFTTIRPMSDLPENAPRVYQFTELPSYSLPPSKG